MKRFIALILVMVFSVTFLTSCKGNGSDASLSSSLEQSAPSQDVAVSSNSDVSQAEEKFDYNSVPIVHTMPRMPPYIDAMDNDNFPQPDDFGNLDFKAIQEGTDLIIRCKANGERSVLKSPQKVRQYELRIVQEAERACCL